MCDNVLKAVLPTRPADDVALLVARTHALDGDRVATWDLPADPAIVAGTRKQVADRLTGWGLADAVFITGLVVSELVTNAIRHARGPIQLRLIRDRTLICEVSDGSSTAPHLRRARAFDEGDAACSLSPSSPGAGGAARLRMARPSGPNKPSPVMMPVKRFTRGGRERITGNARSLCESVTLIPRRRSVA